ncbi:MAG: hypothetical protein IPG46_19830 [Actinobacteria bacterium]|nr:hypothetical protein [Actinomycetota bacterium]
MTTPVELAVKFQRLGAEIGASQKTGEAAAAKWFEAQALAAIAKDTGGDMRLSGVNRPRRDGPGRSERGVIGVATKRLSTGSLVKPVGPLVILEVDKQPHIVTPKDAKSATYRQTTKTGRTRKGTNSRRARQASVVFGLGLGGRAAIRTPEGLRRWARIPRTRGHHTWERMAKVAVPQVPRIVAREQTRALGRVFRP